MAEELVIQCSRLHIAYKEDDVVDLGAVADEGGDGKLSLRLVGWVVTERPLNFDAVKRTLLHVWNLKEGVVIRSMGINLFFFQFFHWRDRDKILNGRPWCFENKLLVLQEIFEENEPSEMVLNFSPFWIRLYNIPFGYCSEARIRVIASVVGEVMKIEEDLLDINPYRRVRVWMDITKPLKRFQMIRTKGNTVVKINIKYERLPHFCFLCGIISHTEKDCSSVSEDDKEEEYGWGMDIRASSRKGVNKLKEEEKALKMKKCLFTPKSKTNVAICVSSTSKIQAPGMHFLEDKIGVEGGSSPSNATGIDCIVENNDNLMLTNEGQRKMVHADTSLCRIL
ncbi:unnamed protein product [Amaranthus hypochondriacus]